MQSAFAEIKIRSILDERHFATTKGVLSANSVVAPMNPE
jgi:hypothetical protein